MMKIKLDSNALVSIGVVVGTGLLGLLKLKDDSNKAAKEKEEIVQEVHANTFVSFNNDNRD